MSGPKVSKQEVKVKVEPDVMGEEDAKDLVNKEKK